MTGISLRDLYRGYIACLNGQDWAGLGHYVGEDVAHNGRPLGLSGYREMLIEDYRAIPDLFFRIDFLVCEPPRIAARLLFHCSPRAEFLGLKIDGRRIEFAENVFYEFRDERIVSVRSIVDKPSIEAQLRS